MKIASIHMGNDLFRRYMMGKYSAAIKRAGAELEWIDSTNNLLSYNGLLLPGGADVNPKLYGEDPIPECGKPNIFRDSLEMEAISIWLKTEKPLLAICRGMQILNVALGGTLYQDIKSLQEEKHSDILNKNKGNHEIEISRKNLPAKRLSHGCWWIRNWVGHQVEVAD